MSKTETSGGPVEASHWQGMDYANAMKAENDVEVKDMEVMDAEHPGNHRRSC